jgi:hypothetical protein
MFRGSWTGITVDGQLVEAMQFKDATGAIHSYTDIPVGGAIAGHRHGGYPKRIVRNPKWPDLEEVILVWKTHNDIGYTHSVPEVLDYYRTGMMDGALKSDRGYDQYPQKRTVCVGSASLGNGGDPG